MRQFFLILSLAFLPLMAKPQTIGFAAGCFWGVEKHFEKLPGVLDAVSGYTGGNYPDPDYHKVLSYRFDTPKGIVNYTETVKVTYDDSKISTEDLIKSFWELHDPTQKNRQGNDRGNNYRSAIFYTTPEQKEIALRTKAEYQKLLTKAGYGKIQTEILPLKKFYPAEAYHQDYLKRNPNGYCPNHSTGVKFPKQSVKKAQGKPMKKLTPLGGKEILVIDAEGCPYCEKFKKDVAESYMGSVPMRFAHEDRIEGYKLKTKIQGTPTIFFIENGKEVAAHTGYLSPKEFYKALGAFKLGTKSEAYDIAFNKGTEPRFCKKYAKFKNVGDGVFVDRLSGQILFDTRDRFNSHSGWLSFYRARPRAVIERPDNSWGMHRTEVLARVSGAHLGHVFDDAPGGRRRYCINATVLDFVPRAKVAEWKKQHPQPAPEIKEK
ncbi:peptide-methionine (S)-S-oxide reductase MsrA [Nitratifractor sp.]